MGISRTAATALTVLGAAGLSAPVAVVAANRSTRAITINPHVGIGSVKLGEKHSDVDRALGRGSLQRRGTFTGSYKYRSGSITIYVTYGSKKKANGVSTNSGGAIVYGHHLSEGQKKLTPVLSRHGWTAEACSGLPFTALVSGGPGTGIIWKNGKAQEGLVGPGSGQCLPPSGY
jgi:hypothetical protein